MNAYSQTNHAGAQVKVNSFIRSVYNWMAIGLALTAGTSFYVVNSETLLQIIFGNSLVFFGLIIGELALVFYLSARIQKIKASTATSLFVLYSILNGATLAAVFMRFTGASIMSTFLTCALTFAACSVYGMVTKRDLTSMGGFLMMGLFGIIIASVLNMFIASPGMSKVIAYVGVLVFVGLTAYDTQKLKEMALTQPADASGAMVRKGAIIGALRLYLDFINMFIMLLQIFGVSRD
jgi:hypothetical protein